MNDVAAVEARIAAWEEADETVLSPVTEGVAAVRCGGFTNDGDRRYTVLMTDGSTEIVEGDDCTCGHERVDEKTDMGTPGKQAWRNRVSSSCEHQKAVLQSVNCGGRCECGELAVEVTEHGPGKGIVTLVTYSCANCGTSRREK